MRFLRFSMFITSSVFYAERRMISGLEWMWTVAEHCEVGDAYRFELAVVSTTVSNVGQRFLSTRTPMRIQSPFRQTPTHGHASVIAYPTIWYINPTTYST